MLHPFDSNFQHTKALSCLIATINCHSCSQAKDKTEIDIFSFFIYFFEWDVQNLHHFSYLYVVCCDVNGIWSKTIREYNHYYPSGMISICFYRHTWQSIQLQNDFHLI